MFRGESACSYGHIIGLDGLCFEEVCMVGIRD